MQSIASKIIRRYMRSLMLFAIPVLCLCISNQILASVGAAGPSHPLDPLSKAEIALTVEILKSNGKASRSSRFPVIALHEPPKAEVLAFKPDSPMRREAFAVVYERAVNKTFEAIVDLNNKSIISWKEVPGAQPRVMLEDIYMVEQAVRKDPRWQQAMKKRGITDFENVQIDPWPAGYYGFPDEESARVLRAVSYYKAASSNSYARPIEGVVAYVNMNSQKVFEFIDTGIVPVPKDTADYGSHSDEKLREAPKPLLIAQSHGASYVVEGNEVRWQNWRFRFAVHPMEGLVLYTVGYEDQGKLRSVLYRASLSEMVVPYGDPGPSWFFRNVFDKGEFGIGWLANSLEPNLDAPNNAEFFNAVFATETGSPYESPRAVALYERDGGLLWKHFDYKHNESRRARDLVLSYIATIGNYDYGFNWIFRQDGSIEMEVLLTGIMAVKAVNSTEAAEGKEKEEVYGYRVGPDVQAVYHQHFFNFRLDMDVDGPGDNSIIEMNTKAVPPGRGNPHMNAFIMTETLLGKEKLAQRQINLASNRKWKVINSSIKNSLDQPTGYILIPGANAVPYAHPQSSVRKRAAFLNAHLWVTQYEPTEMSAAGSYVNQSRGGEGLPKWTSANRSIQGQDIVLWYTLGVTHIPRPEEWPVMTPHRAGFKLVPGGFFIRNPALDVPK